MKITIVLILTIVRITTSGQGFAGKYQDYFGHSLELKKDSTFRSDWRFDLIHVWATGQWTVSGKTLTLKFIGVYDTLSSVGKSDSLVLSIDEQSNKINKEEFLVTALISGGQNKDEFSDRFYRRGKRLFLTKKNGRPSKSRRHGIWPQKTWPWGYKKWPTCFMKQD
ncbi:MAG TPA: hypothetical protein VIU12_28760 [Chryseolinea sp.]